MSKIFFILLIALSAHAQNIKQIFGSSGSVSGSATATTVKTTGIAGQNVIGNASGGAFGTGSGFGEILRGPLILLDAPDGPEPLPTEFNFAQNYPNPFNPSTTFEFALPRASSVRIILYDLLGRETAVIADQFLPAGYYAQHWLAPTDLASGIYFVRFDAAEYHKIRKIMLVK